MYLIKAHNKNYGLQLIYWALSYYWKNIENLTLQTKVFSNSKHTSSNWSYMVKNNFDRYKYNIKNIDLILLFH